MQVSEKDGRFAIFVDAGYVFGAGARLIAGPEIGRNQVYLDEEELRALLTQIGVQRSRNREILRVYWYDAIKEGGDLDHQQKRIAQKDDYKLRLGKLVFAGNRFQQKGVDALIILDLTELARNKAIEDAILLTGDDDIRPAVSVAQAHGIRVHLLGIDPTGENQAMTLKYECDSCTELVEADVRKFLVLEEDEPVRPAGSFVRIESKADFDFEKFGEEAAAAAIDRFSQEKLEKAASDWNAGLIFIPNDIDHFLLSFLVQKTGENDWDERNKNSARERFKQCVLNALGY